LDPYIKNVLGPKLREKKNHPAFQRALELSRQSKSTSSVKRQTEETQDEKKSLTVKEHKDVVTEHKDVVDDSSGREINTQKPVDSVSLLDDLLNSRLFESISQVLPGCIGELPDPCVYENCIKNRERLH
jgi:hypothetical protein